MVYFARLRSDLLRFSLLPNADFIRDPVQQSDGTSKNSDSGVA